MTTKEEFIQLLFTKHDQVFNNFQIVSISHFDENKISILCNINSQLHSVCYADKYAEKIYNLYLEYDRAANTNEN
jgi:hypothetical protein